MTSLATAVAKVGGTTLVSRLLGFVRDLVIARLFGANAATDAFFVAFKIPNLLRRLFAEGAFSMAFVPVLTEYRAHRSLAELKGLVDHVAGSFGLVLLTMTTIGVLAAPVLLVLFAPGFSGDPDQRVLATEMLRLTFPYLLFISLTAFAGGIQNAYERFTVPAFTPVLLNLVMIACALWLAPLLARPITALAWGVLLAGLIQLAFQIPFLARLGLLPRPRLRPRDPGVQRILRRMMPALLGVSVTQINLLIDTLLASFLAAGSISWLYYSDRLVELPLGLLGAALGTVILPRLSRHHVARSSGELSRTLDWALRWVVLLGLPAGVGLMALAGPLIATLFHSGEFGTDDVTMASRSLVAYATGLTPFMAIKVLAPGFYARQDMRTPLRIALVALLANLVLSLALMGPLGHAGLALATSLAALVNATLLLWVLVREGIYRPMPDWPKRLAKTGAATLLMGGLIAVGKGTTADWLAWDDWQRAWHLAGWILLGVVTYVGVLALLGMRPRELSDPS